MKTTIQRFLVVASMSLLGFLTGCDASTATTPAESPPRTVVVNPEPAPSRPIEVRIVAPARVEDRSTERLPADLNERTPPTASNRPLAPEPTTETKDTSNDPKTPRVEEEEEPKEIPPEKDPPIPDTYKPLNKEKTLFFEKTADNKRRVHILAEICLREGQLEVLLCKKQTKEHESILNADLDARDIHFALIAAGAKPGTPVKWVPEYKAATGETIRVTLTYHKDGKLVTKPAQEWIRSMRTKKEMEHDWVFAGSRFFKLPDDPEKPPFYCANNGEVISIANFADAMLDLPVKSSKDQAELGFVAFSERIPPLKTKVIVTLEVLKKG